MTGADISGGTMNNKVIVRTACAALAVSAAACSASTVTGTENLSGTLANSNSTTLPVTATGVVSDHGTLNIGTSGEKAVFDLNKGHLDVTHTNPAPTTTMTANCLATQTMAGTYQVTGGTGSYQGATGHGDYKIVSTEQFTKVNGSCPNPNGNASPTSAALVFHASGPLTT